MVIHYWYQHHISKSCKIIIILIIIISIIIIDDKAKIQKLAPRWRNCWWRNRRRKLPYFASSSSARLLSLELPPWSPASQNWKPNMSAKYAKHVTQFHINIWPKFIVTFNIINIYQHQNCIILPCLHQVPWRHRTSNSVPCCASSFPAPCASRPPLRPGRLAPVSRTPWGHRCWRRWWEYHRPCIRWRPCRKALCRMGTWIGWDWRIGEKWRRWPFRKPK